MNKYLKITIITVLTLVVLAGGTLGIMVWGLGINPFDKSGWVTSEEGYVQYLDKRGEPLTDWQILEGNWYYFDPNNRGAMYTGWLERSGNRYYMDASGIRQGGWLTLPDGTYYLSPTSGIAATGWFSDGSGTYYMDASGRMCVGWKDIQGSRYYFDAAGHMHTGWLELEGNSYYLEESSGILYTGWLESPEGRRYLDETTGAMVTGWLKTEFGRLYMDEEGYLSTGWTDTPEGIYYLDEDGYPQPGWLDWEGKRYYILDDGKMHLGWLEWEGARYYFRDDGTMARGKVIIDETARYFASNGKYVVLVNNWNPIPEDYTTNLVYFGEWRVDSGCYDDLVKMLKDSPYSYEITSAYRSEATQQYIWDKRLKNYQAAGYSYNEAWAMVAAYVAVPGTSEHHLGLAVDIGGSNALTSWLKEHSWEYGFLLRYPEGKEDITGIQYERWHFRYLGRELAAEIQAMGITLEEYMDMLTAQEGSDAGTASNPELFGASDTPNAA